MEYAKPWLSIDDQIDRLASRGLEIADRESARELLQLVGYYRLTGYLYPFRVSEEYLDHDHRPRLRVLSEYRCGTALKDVSRVITFDRELRLLVLEAVEILEVALRTRLGHVLGRRGAFAHEDPSLFVGSFTSRRTDPKTGAARGSRWDEWAGRVNARTDSSDEAFVAHFRSKYDGRMPIWALTEVLELGHLSRLYAGLRNDVATEIAHEFQVPTKRLMESWIATINYVRNIAAHQARLFNRKLVTAPKRPRRAEVPLLAHLSEETAPKEFGVYSALAVMAYLLKAIAPREEWHVRVAAHLRAFPTSAAMDAGAMGIGRGWLAEELWTAVAS